MQERLFVAGPEPRSRETPATMPNELDSPESRAPESGDSGYA